MNLTDALSFLAMEEPLVHYLTLKTTFLPGKFPEPCWIDGVLGDRFFLRLGTSFESLPTKQQAAVIAREFTSLFLGHYNLRLPKVHAKSKLAKRLALNSLMAPHYELPKSPLPTDYNLPELHDAEFYYECLKSGDPNFTPKTEADLDPEVVRQALNSAVENFQAFCPVTNPGRLQTTYGHWLGSASVSAGSANVDWRVALRNFVRSSQRPGDYSVSYKRYSRRWGFPFPGKLRSKLPTVGVVVDTSASNVENFPQILGELRKLRRFAQVVVFQCDTELTVRAELGRGEGFEFHGLGGTKLRPAIELALRECRNVVVLTDGKFDWKEMSGVEALWVVFEDGVPKVGRKA